MIDFHSHILPGIDDGAEDVKMSIRMLRESFRQGVKTVVATPHCYLFDESNIREFIEKRNESYRLLTEAMKKESEPLPEIKLGCELRIMREPSDMGLLRELCIENTDYIMVEMPYKKWNDNHYDWLYSLILKGMRPIMAHIERFWGNKKDFYNLYGLDLVYQINAESVLSFPDKFNIAKLFSEGAVHILGSDMHNTNQRATKMAKARSTLISGYGEDRFNYLMDNAKSILNNEEVVKRKFPEPTFIQKLKL